MDERRARGAEIAGAKRITKALLAEVAGDFHVWMGLKNALEDRSLAKGRKARSED